MYKDEKGGFYFRIKNFMCFFKNTMIKETRIVKRNKVALSAILILILCILNMSLVSASDEHNNLSNAQYTSVESIPKQQQEKIKAQAEQFERVNSLVNEAASNGINVEGIYYDDQKSKYIVQILNEDQKGKLMGINENQEDVDYEVVKYSKKELENYNLNLSDLMQSKKILGLRGHWVDVKSNKVVAIVDELDVKSELTKYVNEDALQIAKLVSFDFHVKSGDKIVESNGGGCTAAFHGKKGTQNVTVTAGHCGYNGTGNSWKFGSTTIGTFGFKTSGNTTADAGYIVLNSSSHIEVTERVTAGTSAVIGGANDAGNEVQGDYIYLSTPYTGYLQEGTVQQTGVSFNAGGEYGFNTLSDIRLTNAVSAEGDSGAPVMKLRWVSAKNRWEFIIQGVNNGTISGSVNNFV